MIKENAELIESIMSFIQKFLQKKYGFGILFFTLFLLAFLGVLYAYKEGKDEGKEGATFEVLTENKLLRRSVVENSTLLMN